MHQYQDTDLIQRLKEGDVSAYDALFLKYYKLLCINAYWFLQNEQEAEDLVQGFFIDIWEKQLYHQFSGDLKGYLHTAVKNRCLNHLKKQQSQAEKQEAYGLLQDSSDAPPEDAGPDYHRKLQHTLNDMEGQKKVAVHLVYMEGKRYKEAADEMGVSVNSFKTHLKRGLKMLREIMKK
ncbi:sigma-70 family RNA polymerase sigma factor [Chitinophaga horti]|uniref:Sigma-70 family RNA polymerase sigma factor n=1 Tax=Chitinophaga horti TaxID=2920382 RepID=A0ABY6IXL0_9BACT|nr:sigma-70 family RNA polymerase sigma factor [Chitinophaga horti]UYQ92118.1 sigma-70 family RNA polymerase sigma factor [Chitinophaga horti]